MAPDYPLTLLEGLTTITHYCLLLHTRKVNHSPYQNQTPLTWHHHKSYIIDNTSSTGLASFAVLDSAQPK